MLAGTPVLASDTGGPRETVLDGATGWLRDAGDVPAWTAVIDRALNETSVEMRERMGRAGVERVRGGFDRGTMARRLEGVLGDMDCLGVKRPLVNAVLNFLGIGFVFWVGILVARIFFPRG